MLTKRKVKCLYKGKLIDSTFRAVDALLRGRVGVCVGRCQYYNFSFLVACPERRTYRAAGLTRRSRPGWKIKGALRMCSVMNCVIRLFMQITSLITITTVCSLSYVERMTKRIGISAQQTGYTQRCFFLHPSSTHSATSRTRLTSLTCEPARSSSTGIKSKSSLSCASENQLLMGTACCG
jgi:hypothetical protein